MSELVSHPFLEDLNKEWDYFEFTPELEVEFKFEQDVELNIRI